MLKGEYDWATSAEAAVNYFVADTENESEKLISFYSSSLEERREYLVNIDQCQCECNVVKTLKIPCRHVMHIR